MKYTTIPITKVEELQVGDKINGLCFLGVNGGGGLWLSAGNDVDNVSMWESTLQTMLDNGAKVERPVQEVSEPPMEFAVEANAQPVTFSGFGLSDGIGILAKLPVSSRGKTFREVTQYSPRVLTKEERDAELLRFLNGTVNGEELRLCRLTWDHAFEFATGCSLLESSDGSIQRGIEDAAAGRVHDLGSFAKTTGEGEDSGEEEKPRVIGFNGTGDSCEAVSAFTAGSKGPHDGEWCRWKGNTHEGGWVYDTEMGWMEFRVGDVIAKTHCGFLAFTPGPSPRQDSADTEPQKEPFTAKEWIAETSYEGLEASSAIHGFNAGWNARAKQLPPTPLSSSKETGKGGEE